MPKLIRITTVPMALKFLLSGQMRYMSQHGFEVIMVSSDGPERQEVIANEQCPHVIVPMTRSITPVKDFAALIALYRFFKKEKPDLVHSHTPKAGLLAMVAAKLAGIKIRIHTVAGLRFMTSHGTTRQLLVGMEKLTGRCATQVWPNSQSLLTYIRENGIVNQQKLEVIGKGSSNGIDLRRFDLHTVSEAGVDRAKATVGYDPGCIYLLTVGRLVRDKGIAELAIAFDKVYSSNRAIRLVLVGEQEPALDPLDDVTSRLISAHPGIICTGWRNDVEHFIAFANVLIHPSHREGFPNVLLQAGALKCPVLCSRIPGNVDIVDDEQTGIIFEVANATSLEEKLRTALEQPLQMAAYAENLLLKVQQHFSRQAVQEAILFKYNELLNEH